MVRIARAGDAEPPTTTFPPPPSSASRSCRTAHRPCTAPTPSLDLQFNYTFQGAGGLLSGAGMGLSVLNATNEEPPFVDTGRIVTGNAPESYDANAIISGRVVALTLTKSF